MFRKRQYTLNWRNVARLMREKAVALLGLAQKAADTLRDIFLNFGEDLNIHGRSALRLICCVNLTYNRRQVIPVAYPPILSRKVDFDKSLLWSE